MKKEYVKPYLALESFQLVAALAGACSGAGSFPLNQSLEKCNAEDEGGGVLFGPACFENVAGEYELCHQVAIEGGVYLTS